MSSAEYNMTNDFSKNKSYQDIDIFSITDEPRNKSFIVLDPSIIPTNSTNAWEYVTSYIKLQCYLVGVNLIRNKSGKDCKQMICNRGKSYKTNKSNIGNQYKDGYVAFTKGESERRKKK